MTQITVRDVPPEVRDELAARVALEGRSMQEYLRAPAREPDAPARVRWKVRSIPYFLQRSPGSARRRYSWALLFTVWLAALSETDVSRWEDPVLWSMLWSAPLQALMAQWWLRLARGVTSPREDVLGCVALVASANLVILLVGSAWSPTFREDFGPFTLGPVLLEAAFAFRLTLGLSATVVALTVVWRLRRRSTAPWVAFAWPLLLPVWGLEATWAQLRLFFGWGQPASVGYFVWHQMAAGLVSLACAASLLMLLGRGRVHSDPAGRQEWSRPRIGSSATAASVLLAWLGLLYVSERASHDYLADLIQEERQAADSCAEPDLQRPEVSPSCRKPE